MERKMIWTTYHDVQSWACSQCEWIYSLPTLLSDAEAREAFDRLAARNFKNHDCAKFPKSASLKRDDMFISRMRELVTRGYKPKDAAELVVQEAMLEHRSSPALMQQARDEAEEFMRRVRDRRI